VRAIIFGSELCGDWRRGETGASGVGRRREDVDASQLSEELCFGPHIFPCMLPKSGNGSPIWIPFVGDSLNVSHLHSQWSPTIYSRSILPRPHYHRRCACCPPPSGSLTATDPAERPPHFLPAECITGAPASLSSRSMPPTREAIEAMPWIRRSARRQPGGARIGGGGA
jgi:hypothetical protein